MEFFAPEFTLRPELPRRIENMNSKEFLTTLRQEITENIKLVRSSPSSSVQMQPTGGDLLDLHELDSLVSVEYKAQYTS